MDTKWKKFRNNKTVKVILFIICVVAIVVALATGMILYFSMDIASISGAYFSLDDLIFTDSYKMLLEKYDNNIPGLANIKPNISAEKMFALQKEIFWTWLIAIKISLGIAIVSLLLLIITTGRKNDDGTIKQSFIDKWFTEINIVVVVGTVFAQLLPLRLIYESFSRVYYYNGIPVNALTTYSQIMNQVEICVRSISFLAGMGISALLVSIGGYFFLSVVRTIKTKKIIKNSLIYKIIILIKNGLLWIWNRLLMIYYAGSPMRKTVVVILAVSIFSGMTFFFAPIVAIVAVFVLSNWVKKYIEVKKGIKEIKDGNLNYRIEVTGKGEFKELAEDINAISEGFDVAVQNELKNQRLKTELISNVSHDLKTPLTSIITYVDLIKKEGIDSENSYEYLDIIDQKSQRLMKLTEDLFDAAKASSGALNVNFEKVELFSLINQGLGEYSKNIEISALEFKINSDKEKYYVNADGQLLWRVVDNLFSNILKYAQENTRVYIDLKEVNTKTLLEIKNISNYELNVSADELMERFKRGDESRTTDGSGLGLAIARDLVRNQNGAFEIKIDGDLFKASILLESWENE